MNYLQLCQEFRRLTGIAGSGPANVTGQIGINDKIVAWIADADLWIQRKYTDWQFLRSSVDIVTIASKDEYSLSDIGVTDYGRWIVDEFFINPGTANYSQMTEYDYEAWMRSEFRLGVKHENEPDKFVVKPDGGLVFIDVPDGQYTVRASYYRSPRKMTDNVDVSPIPEQFHIAIILRAKMFLGEYHEDGGLYQSAEKDFKEVFSELEAHSLPDWHPKTVGSNTLSDVVVEVV